MDLIDRQAAIDANDAAFWETKNKKHYTKLKMLQSHAFLVETALKDLPSAQPETCAYWDRESNICALHRPSAQQNLQLTCNQLATDSISRQAAISAIAKWMLEYGGEGEERERNALKQAAEEIKEFPSAQQEIKPIEYRACANAMLRMWMDNVVTDGEYNRIMDKLNAHWGTKNE